MFVNDLFKKKLNEGKADIDVPEIPRAPVPKPPKEKDVAETALNPKDPQGDYDAKRKVIHDLSLDPNVDQKAVQQRRLDLDREAKSKGLKEQGVAEGSAQDKLYKHHQELRKKSGLPDPDYYKELKASYDLPDEERYAKQKEIKKKYKVANEELTTQDVRQRANQAFQDLDTTQIGTTNNTNDLDQFASKMRTTVPKTRIDTTNWSDEQRFLQDRKTGKWQGDFEGWTQQRNRVAQAKTPTNEDVERYLEEMRRAGYDIVTEAATLCPECGGPAYADQILAEKQDACYSKVKSRYKVWPSAYASGALVRCRKVGAKNWGNKSKK